MEATKVIELLELFKKNDIEVYIDGGWAVDALVGHQTRKHNDLDIALPHRFVTKLRSLLAEKGYREIIRNDTWECNFVLGDKEGNQIDVHSYTFNENNEYVSGVAYSPIDLTGKGEINNYPVNCICPESLVKFHTGYDLDYNDYLDTLALCEKFNIPLPEEHKKFKQI